MRGLDKLVQINGAEVTFESCTFFNGVSCIRAKANSRVTLKNCRFVDCSTCVSGDGLACPRPGNIYDNGQPGPCRITLIDCEAWNCELLARAYEGCEIQLIDCRLYRGGKPAREDGGRVIISKCDPRDAAPSKTGLPACRVLAGFQPALPGPTSPLVRLLRKC